MVDKVTEHQSMNGLQKGLMGAGGGKKKRARGLRTDLTLEQKADIREAFDLLDEKQ
jgi:hypothetical protein